MTMKQPRIPGPQPNAQDLVPDETDCSVAVQALCHGPLDTTVMGITSAAARTGRRHIALRYGRVLLYLEDREALEALASAVGRAEGLADQVFGPPDDAFTQAEAQDRRRLERSLRTVGSNAKA